MKSHKEENLTDFKENTDEQERLYSQFNSIWDKKIVDSQKIIGKLHTLKLLQVVLYSFIIAGIIILINLIIISIHFLIIIINIIIVAIYLIFLKYANYTFKKILKNIPYDFRLIIKNKTRFKDLIPIHIFLYLIILFTTIYILIISMIGINPLIIIMTIGISIIYAYYDKDN